MTQVVREAIQQDTVLYRCDPCDRTAQSAQEGRRADYVARRAELNNQYVH